MLWAGTPGVELGPRHIDWGPGGCARRSLLFGHSLNVGRAAAAAGIPTTLVVALKTTTHTRPLEPMNTLIKFPLVSKFDFINSKTVVVYGFCFYCERSLALRNPLATICTSCISHSLDRVTLLLLHPQHYGILIYDKLITYA